ncbi:hypothetical protein D3C81_1438500 [compost metagenome]
MLFYVLSGLLQRRICITWPLSAAHTDAVQQLLKINLCPEAYALLLHLFHMGQLAADRSDCLHWHLRQHNLLREQLSILKQITPFTRRTVPVDVKIKDVHFKAPRLLYCTEGLFRKA